MKYIAHRGLLDGPNKEKENKPEQIEYTLKQGFDCEIDVWKIDEIFFLGHDSPQYEIEKQFFSLA